MATIRQQIIDMLQQGVYDARELSQALGIREKMVYEHMPHIGRSVVSQGKTLEIVPSNCTVCGFTFKDRKRPSRPSRCPKCRSERIESPKFTIR